MIYECGERMGEGSMSHTYKSWFSDAIIFNEVAWMSCASWALFKTWASRAAIRDAGYLTASINNIMYARNVCAKKYS